MNAPQDIAMKDTFSRFPGEGFGRVAGPAPGLGSVDSAGHDGAGGRSGWWLLPAAVIGLAMWALILGALFGWLV